jgi:DNA invertase Pin-like site-specific DNA recombinase
MGYFGGTYESAQTDERKEFNNMLSFVKKSRDKISCIIVYSVDRSSRSGANAIYIAQQLKQSGVVIFSVTQPRYDYGEWKFATKYPVHFFRV